MSDIFKTIALPSDPILFKDKNSKFFGYAFPVGTEKEVKNYLQTLKTEHQGAGHWCYAYQIGTNKVTYRTNDNGEPNNSAGLPIYGQIQSFELTNVLVVVVRYFGGTKLGVSGLISAYRTTAQMTLSNCEVIEKTINQLFKLKFDYKNLSKVLQILKKNKVDIIEQIMELDCLLTIKVRKRDSSKVFETFSQFFGVEISEL